MKTMSTRRKSRLLPVVLIAGGLAVGGGVGLVEALSNLSWETKRLLGMNPIGTLSNPKVQKQTSRQHAKSKGLRNRRQK